MSAFASGFLLSLSLCLDLGLVNVAILRVAVRRGATPAFAVGLGSCAGDLVYAMLSVAGVTALLTMRGLRWALWLGGTAALAWLAGKMLREVARPRTIDVDDAQEAPTSYATFGRDFGWGASLALASPSSVIWFAAVGGSMVASHGGQRAVLAPFLSGFFAAGAVWSASLAYGAERLRRRLGPRLGQTLALASALLFVYFAVSVFLEGARTLL